MHLSIILLLLVTTTWCTLKLEGCDGDDKYCVGMPRGCIHPKCFFAFSTKSNGTHVEIELFSTRVRDYTYLAIAYSEDEIMDNDFVIYCLRDDRNATNVAGMAFNNHHNFMDRLYPVEELKEVDTFGFGLQLHERSFEDGNMYCRMTHLVDPIIARWNTTKLDVLMAKGIWHRYYFEYHYWTRSAVGQVDLSGAKKPPVKKSASSAISSLIISIVVFICYY